MYNYIKALIVPLKVLLSQIALPPVPPSLKFDSHIQPIRILSNSQLPKVWSICRHPEI